MASSEFKQARQKRNLTQTEVARVMGMLPGDYNKIEAGAKRKPTKIHLRSFKMAIMLYDLGKWSELLSSPD